MNIKKKNVFKEMFNYYKDKKKIPKIDFHIHTNWTDGKHSVREMARTAQKRKLKMILFSEHSRKSSKNWFNKFVNQIREYQKKSKECKMFIGTEVKIKDFKGSLDINNSIKKCDFVMASVHRFPGEKGNIFKNKPKISKKEVLKLSIDYL